MKVVSELREELFEQANAAKTLIEEDEKNGSGSEGSDESLS